MAQSIRLEMEHQVLFASIIVLREMNGDLQAHAARSLQHTFIVFERFVLDRPRSEIDANYELLSVWTLVEVLLNDIEAFSRFLDRFAVLDGDQETDNHVAVSRILHRKFSDFLQYDIHVICARMTRVCQRSRRRTQFQILYILTSKVQQYFVDDADQHLLGANHAMDDIEQSEHFVERLVFFQDLLDLLLWILVCFDHVFQVLVVGRLLVQIGQCLHADGTVQVRM
mmetsp:Transcript_5169/g.8697  ORF Transcript_5169/g.8697 Transcript_5169/m.8697 type:complete len:226 (+) Transcript_5169:478-1155(+)